MSRRLFVVGLIVLAGCSSQAPVVEPSDTSILLLPSQSTVPEPAGVYVADLTGSAINQGNTWVALAEILIIDDAGTPVGDVLVAGAWSEGGEEEAACTTATDGTCEVESDSIRKRVGSATFEILGVEHATLQYQPGLDEEYDPENGPVSLTVDKP